MDIHINIVLYALLEPEVRSVHVVFSLYIIEECHSSNTFSYGTFVLRV